MSNGSDKKKRFCCKFILYCFIVSDRFACNLAMRIKFNTKKSGFYDKIKSALEDSPLDGEVTVLSNKSYSYVEEEIEVLLSDKDESHFNTDWWKAQASLFPARVKAVCTVLRDLKLYGNFRISNNPRGLSVSKMSTSDLESHFLWDIISKTTAVKVNCG